MRLSSGLVTLSALALTAPFLAGCSAFSDDTGDGQVSVAAAFYPLAYVAEQVVDGTGTQVDLLTQPGTEPHDLELTIKETAELSDADLVVYESGFQPAVDDAVEQNASGATLDATKVVDPIALEERADDHAEHADEGSEEGEHHDHGDLDPHFWQDPLRMADLADAVADRLADVDDAHAERYRTNAQALRAELTALDEDYAAGLADCARDTIVVSHDAFGYLEKYGLHVASIVGLSPDAEPTGAVLGELQELIRTEGITTVFSEPLKPALGESFAHDLGLTNGVLDPVEGLTDATAEEDYLSLMKTNLATLRTANDCR
ncbi:metal ABC transporter substrate-binding protein [Nocardioides daeguensis]|uniref:Zinc ABC transporter substrate-binding protein n=1 Tax=Nocardioides daeguensis TaxID=908359 RepID=A0ABP6VQ67_9ACTN|nr:metal ABC transporter substrate-binding protein [Nocardioides daeguensis]MBV6727469.1 metal ABC transporter substrate-binding protein [Nocardioides daeguensis]MCR1773309.1 metal ABC transporter substrate-binding protein [Nocardioides daeguensis]